MAWRRRNSDADLVVRQARMVARSVLFFVEGRTSPSENGLAEKVQRYRKTRGDDKRWHRGSSSISITPARVST